MKLRFSGKRADSKSSRKDRSFFSRAKGKMLAAGLAVAVVFGAISCGKSVGVGNENNGRADVQQIQDSGTSTDSGTAACECPKFNDEIKEWSENRSLDPMFTCAVAESVSDLDPHAAAKVCKEGYDGPGCFQPGASEDEGYPVAYDEMYIPEGTIGNPAPLMNDIPVPGQLPNWRWLALGLMQAVEPPVSFWPASHAPGVQDGQYYDIFNRAPISSSVDLDQAKECNSSSFNPFMVNDSLCVGTAKLQVMKNRASAWISQNRDKLNWDVDQDQEKTELFKRYVVANMYVGLWDASNRVATTEWYVHPRCDSTIKNGDCWALGFKKSWQAQDGVLLDNAYCSSSEGQSDPIRCTNGQPRKEPPGYCYGYMDFLQFVQDCEVPFLPNRIDFGSVVIQAYLRLKQNCG